MQKKGRISIDYDLFTDSRVKKVDDGVEMNRDSSVRLRPTAAPQSRLYDSLKQCCEPGDSSYGVIGQWLPSRIEDSYPQKDVGEVTSALTSCRVVETHSCLPNLFRCM